MIVRDTDFGLPHIYGATRPGTEFGAGYAAAEDRLFMTDALRHAGRGQLAAFAGGAPANRAMDRGVFIDAPYREADLQRQIDRLPQLYGADGQQLVDDATSYVDGINAYIDDAKLDITRTPGEYLALGRPLGPDPWKPTDLLATASLIGGVLGQGGGNQLSRALILDGFRQRFGPPAGTTLRTDWRGRNDPEAPTTVTTGQRFPYALRPTHPAPDATALPDPGSVRHEPVVTAASGAGAPDGLPSPAASSTRAVARAAPPGAAAAATTAATAGTVAPASLAASRGRLDPAARAAVVGLPSADSNALLVGARHSASGHPLAVMGPQVGYFNPQILLEEDLHGLGLDARGAAVAGLSLYVELGHGGDYAWSATSAGQDIVHTFAAPLCNPDGSPPTVASNSYSFRGQCTPMDELTQTESWTPNRADQTPPGSETLTATNTGACAHAHAIALLDAWWPLLVAGEFRSVLGPALYDALTAQLPIDDPPNRGSGNPHVGSAYDTGWFGYVDKDLRHLLHLPEAGAYHRVYCGGGNLAACRQMLDDTLRQAVGQAADPATLYADPVSTAANRPGDQECFDAISFRPIGITTDPLMPWVNRPTYQQAVEVAGHRPR